MERTGVLLINVGGPSAPTTKAVGQFLTDYLSDPNVLELPSIVRLPLVNLGLVPTRKKMTAKKYKAIWEREGNPLVLHSQYFAEKLRRTLGDAYVVELGMRYGRPSIEEALLSLKFAGIQEVVVWPMYPHFTRPTTETAMQEVERAAESLQMAEQLHFIEPFHSRPAYLDALGESIISGLAKYRADHILFSFQSLPRKSGLSCESQLTCRTSGSGCDPLNHLNNTCYRAQCFSTVQGIVQRLSLDSDYYSIGFQSELSAKWIGPSSFRMMSALANVGIRNLAVVCPSFVTDCVESLEEMGIRGREHFLREGGKDFRLIPALNSSDTWVRASVKIIEEECTSIEKELIRRGPVERMIEKSADGIYN